MNKITALFAAVMISIIAAPIFSIGTKKNKEPEKDLYEYNNIISLIEKTDAPKQIGEYIMFTHPANVRFVGIVFDFENYEKIHPFNIHNRRDIEGKITSSVMFYLLERPEDITEIGYRLIIDGLWTADPVNPLKVYDSKTRVSISKVYLDSIPAKITNAENKNSVKFVYNGNPGQTIRLAGTFTNWDSWIYELKETAPGFYELDIPLPAGTYYYNYYLGMKPIVDKTNPARAYTNDGRTASVIEVR